MKTTNNRREYNAMDELDTQNRQCLIARDPTSQHRTWVKAPAGGGKTTFLLSIAQGPPCQDLFTRDILEGIASRRQTACLARKRQEHDRAYF